MPETELLTNTAPNEGEGGSTEINDADLAAEVEADLKQLDETDPQRKLAREVEADLAALGSEGSEKETNQDTAGAQPPEPGSKLAKVIAERSKAFEEKQKTPDPAVVEAQRMMAEAQRARHEAELFANQVKQQAVQLRAFQQALKEDPAAALEAMGINPEEFLFGIAKQGSPEYAQSKELQALKQKTEAFEKWQKDQEKKHQEALRQQQVARMQQMRQGIERQFMDTVKTKGKNIALALEAGLVNEKSLFAEGDSIADRYRDLTGEEATMDDIVEYIDERISKAYNRIKGTHQAAAPSPQSTPAPSAKPGKKTLTSDDASVRTALQAPISPEDSEDERKARAVKAVKLVMERARARSTEE